ncbi:MAG: tetratricopeptide repeat protein [Candidatus Eremiobacteraeota bacterium]|nr:tetratricopeptide repeat protein [Candidatus Eremiobacteraeota bacterium]
MCHPEPSAAKSKNRLNPLALIAAGVLTALALWPFLSSHQTPAATFTPAPLVRDYLTRNAVIAFYEKQVRQYPADQIQLRILAQLYMQRFREQYDLGDITRAERAARRSIQLQPQGNTSAEMTLAAARLSYHDFRGALAAQRRAWQGEPFNANAVAQIASLQMEIGEYAQARATLARIPAKNDANPTVQSVRARYEELNGQLDAARSLIAAATQTIDSDVGNPAYDRSWYHMRAAQLAYEANDNRSAEREFAISLDDDPNNATALLWEARMYRTERRWRKALAAATRSADLYPLPQALGYKADAQRALGDDAAAAQTDALIDAEARLFNVNGINDRLLANYYAERHHRLTDALRAAESDRAKRGDEIYSDDTMAQVLEALGRWREAYRYALAANRLHTSDPELRAHLQLARQHSLSL